MEASAGGSGSSNGTSATEQCQILVRIVEVRQLAGNDIDPFVQVAIGQQIRTTKTKRSANDAVFEEDFVFEFSLPKVVFLQNIISITAFSDNGIFRSHKAIGCFKIDAATVNAQPGQGFFRKWAMLLDVDDPMSGPKGYVKCDILATVIGSTTKRPLRPVPPAVDEDDIEGNLLVPDESSNLFGERQPAKFVISIFRAESLPTLNATGMFNVKKAFVGQAPKALVNPYVQVSFAGKTGKTKVIKHDSNPEWNQEIVFVELFPALVKTIRIHVRDEAGAVLATTLLNLDNISDNGPCGYLPTFGPAYINLYGNFRSNVDTSTLNYGLGEGLAYRGRLCLAVRVELLEFFPRKGMHKVDVANCPPTYEDLLGEWQDFALFGAIFDASMIDKRYANKSLHFELSMGEFGCFEDTPPIPSDRISKGMSKSVESLLGTGLTVSSSGISSGMSGSVLTLSTAQGSAPDVNVEVGSATTDKTVPKKSTVAKGEFCHINYGGDKPIFNLSVSYQYHCRRYKDAAIIDKIYKTLDNCLTEIEKMLELEKIEEASMQMQNTLCNIAITFPDAINLLTTMPDGSLCIQTDLDRQKRKQRVDLLKKFLGEFEKPLNEQTIREMVNELCAVRNQLKFLTFELQECLPDIFLWLCHHNKRIGYKRFRAYELLFLDGINEDAQIKTRLQTFFLKQLPIDDAPTTNVGVITAYFWLSLSSDCSPMFQGLPDGFSFISDSVSTTRCLRYSDSCDYQLRCYLFQGRSLVGSDDSGLSDPFVRIVFKEHVMESQVIDQTISPVWDETLVLPLVNLHGSPDYYAENPPKIIMQVYDFDKVGKNEFLGQTETYPVVKQYNEMYLKPKLPPALQSWALYRSANEDVGDVMACFELIQITADMIECPALPMPKNAKSKVIPLPVYIKPALCAYYLEVFFWGLRDLKPTGVLPIEDPSVEVECGEKLIRSGPVKAVKKLLNFKSSKQEMKIFLPENPIYRPPLNIRCLDKKTFGRFVLIGSCTVQNIEQFMIKEEAGITSGMVSTENMIENIDEISLSLVETKSTSTSGVVEAEKHDSKSEVSINVEKTRSASSSSAAKKKSVDVKQQQKPIEVVVTISFDEKKTSEPDESDQESKEVLDWWSKYYASVRAYEIASKTKSSTNDSTTVVFIDETKKTKKRGRKRFIKSKVTAVAKFIKNYQVTSEIFKDNPEKHIELLKIYPYELENVSEFNGFFDCFHPFTLFRGKKSFSETDDIDRTVGKFKGLVSIRRAKQLSQDETTMDDNPIFRTPTESTHVLIRVYVIQAKNLRPCDPTGKADPYLFLSCGNTKISDKQNRIYCQLNPVFGRMFEFEATLPEEYELTIRLFDWDRLSSDDLMGETKIDLEQRFYSKHRATCGLQAKYETKGYNCWRDSMKPSQILSKLCRQYGLTGPFYGNASVTVGTKKFQLNDENSDNESKFKTDSDNLALYALRNWQEMPRIGYRFVPEHVETRTLYLPDKPGLEQGTLEMWVDMFPMDGPQPPAPVDITPRKPNSYQLRAIIWDTKEVVLDDYNALTGQSSVDQYLKGFVIGPKADLQQTDIHYRSLNGEGNFNWRFIFNFDYSEAEEKIIYKTKQSAFSLSEHEEKLLPRINLQLWDADVITSDDYLGTLSLDLTKIPTGAKSAKLCSLDTLKGKSNSVLSAGKAKAGEINLFKAKRTRGWWPFVKMEGKEQVITGKADIEFQILTVSEVEKKPAGVGRDPPDPMPPPQRPETSFAWFSSPFKMLKYDIWIGMRWRCCQILVILIFVLFFALFIYQLPQSVAEKLVLG